MNPSPIVTGVPQGSSISPILFSIFINDIPMRSIAGDSYSLLYADDLTVFFSFKNVRLKDEDVSRRAQTYLVEIEEWLCKWRMRMAPSKCNYTVYSKKNACRSRFGLSLFGEIIPYEKNPVSLGITFNECLNFESQVKKIKANCVQRLNIIKILSHKSWKLSEKTLVSIYRSLIRSVLDYSAFMAPCLSSSMRDAAQALQNKAVRIIFHRPSADHTTDLCRISGLELVETRMTDLNTRYFRAANSPENELISALIRDFGEGFRNSRMRVKTLL